MKTVKKSTLEFLGALKTNNNRDWFQKNKKAYNDAKENFESFIQEVIDEVIEFDPILKGLEARSCIFRINRDIRFSHDKSPYKTNMGAFIVRGGRKNGDKFTGYYIHAEPGNCFIAGGAYMPPAPWLNAIREKIDEETARFLKIINDPVFRKYFGGIEGEKLKKAPKGYPPDHPHVELLKHKSFLVMHEVPEKKFLDEGFFDQAVTVCRAMKPFNDFLNEK